MAAKMSVSLICTVLNEEDSVRDLVESMLNQSHMPDEIVIVDGGSTDKTAEIIGEYARKSGIIKLIVEKGANISKGRNIAIRNANGPVIAATDGGCILDRDWLKFLMEEVSKGAAAVAGRYEPKYRNFFEQCQGELLCSQSIIPSNFEGCWFPSSRSEAFLKKVWEDAGGYPEHLYTAEDALFHHRIADLGYKYVLAERAMVKWSMRPTWKKLYKQFFNYGKGEAQAKLLLKLPRSMFVIFGFYAFLLAVAFSALTANIVLLSAIAGLFLVYGFFMGIRVAMKVKNFKGVFYGFGIELTRRAGFFAGYHKGFFMYRI